MTINLTTAESNVLEMLGDSERDANVVVNGKLVRGRMTEYMECVLRWKARFESLPESTTEQEWDALGAEMRADLERIEPSSRGRIADADDTQAAVESMTADELLKGLEDLAPPEAQPQEQPSTRPAQRRSLLVG